eukprot:CAMPEP_0204901360 /NCGR_PEP_ID=MMETSP1397-20131031/3041_1 /ASSEMBLY_ACC=CAM_ASM_000891 /TAXON_ID=49980 /ORGANISM="Climacostomum Climacostomum virens, Strain Stock W-24" /LENGTH=319 /DNA_ID=CAMNT_0052069717 /DNA_START=73 /DNA_END=1032 /DNA_ORIENTATION=+
MRPLFKVSTSKQASLFSPSSSYTLSNIQSPRKDQLNSLRIGCPTGTIIHIPRNVAVLRENLSAKDIKKAFNIDELIDTEASIRELTLPEISPIAAKLLEPLKLPLKSFSSVKLVPRQFTLLSPDNESDSEDMQLRAINRARKVDTSQQPSPKPDMKAHERTLTKPNFNLDLFRAVSERVPAGAREFIQTAKSGKVNEVISLLTKNKKLIHSKDSLNCTALHWAVKRNNLELIRILMQEGADCEEKDISGRSPMSIAVKQDSADILEEFFTYRSISDLMQSKTFFYLKEACPKGSKCRILLERREPDFFLPSIFKLGAGG